MGVHSVLLTNRNGMVLFKKYYDATLDDESILLQEQALVVHSEHMWQDAFVTEQVLALDELAVVFRGMNDVLVFVSGTEEYNELILSDLLKVLIDVLVNLCTSRDRVNEAHVLNPDIYGKFAVCLDQMIFQGQLEESDVKTILRLSKMKPLSG
eukprot:scaffold2263_cov272-Pinguiococcus_pyrenoidosus.AAC.10